jgi:hypothetical protein
MEKWLIEIGNKYLNNQRVSFACKALIILQVIVLFSNLDNIGAGASMAEMSRGLYSAVGIFLQPLQDICMTILFLGLMRILYKKGYTIPISAYVVVIVFANAILTFLTKFSGTSHGLLLGLISLAYYVLVCLLGIKLRATPYATLGNVLILYSAFDLVDGVILQGKIPLTIVVTIGLLIYLAITFNKILSPEFDKLKNEQS